MTINLHIPDSVILKPCIAVFGVGGAGGNAVNNMIQSNLEGVKFVIANTDAQALEYAVADRRIQLGEHITRGLGAGAAPEVGRAAAEESMEFILEHLEGSNMVFITAGMGGGTGTGAAPVIAKAAREKGILTVGVVTKPFHFEGSHRMKIAELGLQELQKYVDTLIVIPNQNLFRIANEKTTFSDAFKMADDVLHAGVRGVTDLMIMPGLINLDFADIRAVMSEMGKAMMGTGEATGEKRALHAAEAAISNPLLDNVSMKGARGVLINITGGPDMTLFEVDEAANRIRDEVDPDANIIFGSTFNPDLEGKIRVSVVATGIDSNHMPYENTSALAHALNSAARPMAAAQAPEPARPQPQPQPQPQAQLQEAVAAPQAAAPAIARAELASNASAVVSPALQQASLAKQFGLQEEEDGEVFFSPRPVEPKNPVFVEQQAAPQAAARAQAPAAPTYAAMPVQQRAEVRTETRVEEKAPEKEAPRSGFGLFGRTRRAPEPEPVAQVRHQQEELVGAGADTLDIPAFLRRKNPNNPQS